MSDKNTNGNKIKRNKFFLYSGAMVFGMFAASKFPFSIFKSAEEAKLNKTGSIKITQNPNAVSRKSREVNTNNGSNG